MTLVHKSAADEAPDAAELTSYDEARMVMYLRLLDAEAAGADWHDVARIVLERDVVAEPEKAHRCWESHLKRAHWIAEAKYHSLRNSAG